MKKNMKKLMILLSMMILMSASTLVSHAKWENDSTGWWYSKTEAPGYAVGWEQIDGKWYLFGADGYMLTGWQCADSVWYYFNPVGDMAHDCWVGNYYLTTSGAMATNQWIGDYYVGNDGIWIPTAASEIITQEENTQSITYVLNTSTKKFHYLSCSSVASMKAKNYQESQSSRDSIIASGYEPCKKCNP